MYKISPHLRSRLRSVHHLCTDLRVYGGHLCPSALIFVVRHSNLSSAMLVLERSHVGGTSPYGPVTHTVRSQLTSSNKANRCQKELALALVGSRTCKIYIPKVWVSGVYYTVYIPRRVGLPTPRRVQRVCTAASCFLLTRCAENAYTGNILKCG